MPLALFTLLLALSLVLGGFIGLHVYRITHSDNALMVVVNGGVGGFCFLVGSVIIFASDMSNLTVPRPFWLFFTLPISLVRPLLPLIMMWRRRSPISNPTA
jgi:hypothetical protein